MTALPISRKFAKQQTGCVRDEAIKALGAYGHPMDFEFLIEGLRNPKPEEVLLFAYALYEYGDLRAVPDLIPALSTADDNLFQEVVSCITHLLTPDGIKALQRCAESEANEQRRELCDDAVNYVLRPVELSFDEFSSKSESEKNQIVVSLRARIEDRYRTKPIGERTLSHTDLLKAADEWKSNHRITGGAYAWVEDRHVMGAATPADIPLILDVVAKLYARLSDECLYEVNTLHKIIRRLNRSRYRRQVGICDRALPL